ncbi:Nodulin MtN21 /EamA-like transporter family protein isoform 2 [Theobroma cacao]|uniref:Nodulin MtN21 /EamA-like transporter family protein isoform 2 n=1 Tax=Theobroma cacao TaxID=3641 RepID=A0A061FI53_THECC|nr:Nodulin MtN21 /EamA-like transporter family protein isoform 2 [Theobroma cacao]
MKSLIKYAMVMENHKPYIAMLFVQFIYAGMALFSKAAIAKGMSPYVFVVYRQAFATVALAPFAFFLERLTLSLNLYYVAINYTTATFAAATTNTIPVLTFTIAVCLRTESICIRQLPGIAKVFGSVTSLSGALVFAFVKGPPIKFMNWYPATQKQTADSLVNSYSIGEWIKGSLIMLAANTAWSLWLVLQGHIVKQYPAKIRLTALQCFFSCIQSTFWAIAAERNSSAWRLGWDVHLLSVAYCGCNCHWHHILAASLDYREERSSFHSNFYSISSCNNSHLLCIPVEGNPSLGKSIGGVVLLVGGLYSVLWGKKREDGKGVTNEQNPDTKEETVLECITHH